MPHRLSAVLIGGITAVAFAQIASAADLPRKAPVVAPPPPPSISWTGWYVGLNAGGTWGGEDISVSSVPTFAVDPAINTFPVPTSVAAAQAASGALSTNNGAFIGGGQIGYNWQLASQWVTGIEADIQGVGGGNKTATQTKVVDALSGLGFLGQNVTATVTASKKLDYLGTVRGRLGFLSMPTFLIYGTGGLAYGGVSSSTGIGGFTSGLNLGLCCGPMTFASAGSFSEGRVGWTAGGGVEWMFAPNWSAKAEYLYYDLGSVTYSAGNPTAVATGGLLGAGTVAFVLGSQTTTRFNGNIARAGVNYHF
jgi:outer membrane immunogenic protein